jgi:hypothetical protein
MCLHQRRSSHVHPASCAEAAVDVHDDEDQLVGHGGEHLLQVVVAGYRREVEVIDVEAEVVGHGGDHAGLAGAGRAVEQVPALPRLADPPVVLPTLQEPVEVVHDGPLLRVERGRVLVADAPPRPPALGQEDLEGALPPLRLGHRRRHERDIPAQRRVHVLRVKAEVQRRRAPFAAVWRDGRPHELDAFENVPHRVACQHRQDLLPAGVFFAVLLVVAAAATAAEAHPVHGARVDPGGEVRARVRLEPVLAALLVARPDDDGAPLRWRAAGPAPSQHQQRRGPARCVA